MDIAEIATMAFIASGMTYNAVKYWRVNRKVHLAREWPVHLILKRTDDLSEECRRAVLLVFDRRGYLVRKYPEADVLKRRKRWRLRCTVQEGMLNFCVLFTPHALCLSGIHHRDDVSRLFAGHAGICIAETGLQEIIHGTSLELIVVGTETDEETEKVDSATLNALLPTEVITDAMAKELPVELKGCSEQWHTGSVHYAEGEPDNWLAVRREGDRLLMQFRTNFSAVEREATIEIGNGEGVHLLKVRQQVMGIHPTLTVSRRLYVSTGRKNEAVTLTVIPDNEQACWCVRSANANDGGCWYSVYPPVGLQQKGSQNLKVHLEAKPASVRSRSLVLTLETGTYPFSQTTDLLLMQGVCFDYYIEYPPEDPCARHSRVIETPPDYREEEGVRTYIVCVDSNQSWRIVSDKAADWVEVSEPELLQGHYDGRFTVKVHSNAGYRVRGGFPAARHTVLSLVNDTGVVRDILIYQGGYVRIRGKYWLDRNLAAGGKLAQVAIPLGLEVDTTLNQGTYFQFGCPTDRWEENFTPCRGSWYDGTAESPARINELDPSPEGWRLPSRIEMEALMNSPAAPMELQREEDRTNICLLSDDGVPVYLPLCGHRSHINGCRIVIPHGHRYWTGSSQSLVYGYSLCVEPSRQMYLMHDMKKYGFPVRSIFNDERQMVNDKL